MLNKSYTVYTVYNWKGKQRGQHFNSSGLTKVWQ